MRSMTKTGLVAVTTLGLAVGPALAASAHTPAVTDTCDSVSANLTNYETRVGTPAVETVYGPAPLVTPAVEAVPAVLEYEYAHADHGNGSSDRPRWEAEGWNAGDGGKGWVPTGATRIVTPAVPAAEAVYGEPPLVTPAVDAVPAEDNGVSLVLDGVTVGSWRFGSSFAGTYPLDGSVAHDYAVIIDAIGTDYDVTITGTTELCVVVTPPPVDVPPVDVPPTDVPPVDVPPTYPENPTPLPETPEVPAAPPVVVTPDVPVARIADVTLTSPVLASTGPREDIVTGGALLSGALLLTAGVLVVIDRVRRRPRYSRTGK